MSASESPNHVFNRRKGLIVGNDQDGDDSVITAHVCESLFFPYSLQRTMDYIVLEYYRDQPIVSLVSYKILLYEICCSRPWNSLHYRFVFI